MHIGHHWDSDLLHISDPNLNFLGHVHWDTLVTLWITMAIIIFFAALAVGKIKLAPSKLQAFFENIVTNIISN